MELDVSDLVRVLKAQKKLIYELLGKAGEQLQALKADSLDKIVSLTSHQEYIGRQLALLEQKRRLIIDQYAQVIGIEIKNFSELLLYTGSNDREEIQGLRDEIIEICRKLDQDNELNASLLKQSLRYTDRVLGVLNGKNSFVYGKSGGVQKITDKGCLDTSA